MSYFQWNDKPVCPYCLHEDIEDWDMDFHAELEDMDASCPSCGKDYFLERKIEVRYRSYK